MIRTQTLDILDDVGSLGGNGNGWRVARAHDEARDEDGRVGEPHRMPSTSGQLPIEQLKLDIGVGRNDVVEQFHQCPWLSRRCRAPTPEDYRHGSEDDVLI